MAGIKKRHIQVIGLILLFLTGAALLWYNDANSNQAIGATAATVRFEGEWRIGEGPWQNITEEKHIPSTKGDVTLRGNFYLYSPGGEFIGPARPGTMIALYSDHISVSVCEREGTPYVLDHENPLFGSSACGVDWTAYTLREDGTEPVEIMIHNPHRFGNATAVDELIANIAIWGNIDFERGILESGEKQRASGMLFVIVSLALLGTALFSTLLHVHSNRIIWLMGMAIFFAGVYSAYSASGVSFWRDSVTGNTTILGLSMMFYMLFVTEIITRFLQKTQKTGFIATIILGVMDMVFFVLPMVTKIFFYDTWLYWVIGQTLVNVVLLVCLAKEFLPVNRKKRFAYVGMSLLLVAFELDVIATALGSWKGGFLSKHVFVALFAASLIIVLRIIPGSINATAKARELELQRSRLAAEKNMMESELKESRISLMLSQIQPHFIYNTLGTIERMCLKDPQKASELVRNFSLYLRGNFSELNSVTPIRFTEELKHVEYYINIEKVRFPDMNIEYEVKATGFVLPALSVQPLVENAIKHGLMRLESGGTVVIRSYETEAYFCVEVKDNGGGFDTSLPIEEKKHVGLRNIRERLKVMVNGELLVESVVGAGTTAVIKIPKEVM